jgi:CheY-like chemotaxis protein
MTLTRNENKERTGILAVDDNPTALRLLVSMLERREYNVATAVNGKKALQYLYENPDSIDIILLDKMMPEMDGLEVCEVLKSDPVLKKIPVIMQTAADKPEEISEGIKAGVFYYLTKPLNAQTLLSVVDAAEKQIQKYKTLRDEMQQSRLGFGLVQILKCTLKTLEEAESLSSFLANLFPDPDKMITGISELMINAVEHGNLGISYEEKSVLINENQWQQEIERRQADPRWAEKIATVVFERRERTYYLQISDQGEGFDWSQFMEVEPSRAMHNHGRGIAMANMLSFDKLVYNDKGNQVTCSVTIEEDRVKDAFWD